MQSSLTRLPVLVGHPPPDRRDEVDFYEKIRLLQAPESAISANRLRPQLADPGFDWAGVGLEPRWLGEESADCVAALNLPLDRGAQDELDRLATGCALREETAPVIHSVGELSGPTFDTSKGLLGRGTSKMLPGEAGLLIARELPVGASVDLAADLDPADRDLALRIRNSHTKSAGGWVGLEIGGFSLERTDSSEYVEPTAVLRPLLVTAVGDVAAAVWDAPGRFGGISCRQEWIGARSLIGSPFRRFLGSVRRHLPDSARRPKLMNRS
jgi:hypothetical protein